MSIVFQVIVAILVFGLLIFVHELGHFTVGKLSGLRWVWGRCFGRARAVKQNIR